MPNDQQMDRRQFAGALAGSSAAGFLLASQPVVGDDNKPTDTPKDAKPNTSEEQPVKPPMEALLLGYLIQRYPSDQYDDVSLKGIYGDIRGDVARGRVLSSFPLKNSDEPAFVFRAYRRAD